ncbi:MAG: YdcF family protein, partial [Erysipelotrichaceae bacterium]|nr:YdcF family protein [Erysipelotrichaceae bacterium]
MCYNIGMDDEYLSEYQENEETEEEEFDEPEVTRKKRRFGFSNVLIIIYMILHIAYTGWMFTDNWVHAMLWLLITIVELSVFSVILKVQNKIYLAGRVLSLIFVLTLLLNSAFSGFMLLSGSDKNTEGADYVLVMGFGLVDDQMDEILKARCDKAIEYLQQNPGTTAVLCGGVTRGSTISEALAMKNYIVKAGIPESRLLLEDGSTNTKTNLSNAKGMINTTGKIVVISSDYHLFRVREVCRQAGLNARNLAASTPILQLPDK